MTHQQPRALANAQVPLPLRPSGTGALSGTGRAHGKVILLGEHAAVYGAPAVAVPLPALSCTVTAAWTADPGGGPGRHRYTPFTVPGDGLVSPATGGLPQGLCLLIDTALRRARRPDVPVVGLTLASNIPYGRGLGSSAACAHALTHALDQLLHLRLSAAEVFEYVQISETATHGRASGIDALAVGSTRPVLLSDGRPRTPPVSAQAWIVVADSGNAGDTRQAVTMLRDAFDEHPLRREDFLAQSASLTRRALRALEHGRLDRLGQDLTDCHSLLAGLQLSTKRVDALVNAALGHGALGAKMTGGGLGGCAIALTDSAAAADTLAEHLRRNDAVNTWTARIEQGGPV
ncbi:mevalonate kinase (plasmid) [Streptomyces murinus]|uniref:mevalonate kinase n=1 Tax=Streptomyces murinus TaxID=33900 RepID=UPI001551CE87|nr:mevalonate kinase [Streptomyces murinus]WDO11228.1 mevalonate kinase [Streptomyces murinus]